MIDGVQNLKAAAAVSTRFKATDFFSYLIGRDNAMAQASYTCNWGN